MKKRSVIIPNARLYFLTVVIIISISISPNQAIGQTEIGDEWLWGIRTWVLVDDSNPIPVIRGKIVKIKYNDCWYCDDDLNVFILPDNEYDYTTINRDSNINGPLEDGEVPAGSIEAEVNSIISDILFDLFKPWMNVLVAGWWVEDSGHDDKTELHPIRYMVGELPSNYPDSNRFSIFMAQDFSGRFNVSGDEYDQLFHLHIPSVRSVIRPDEGQTGGVSPAGILNEKSMLDFLPEPMRSYYEAIIFQFPNQPEVRLYIKQDPCNWGNFYLPFYVGEFERTTRNVFEDNVEYSVETDEESGIKVVKITVDAELLGTGTDALLKYSKWVYEKNENQMEIEYKDSPPHRVHFTREYSPAMGKNETSWTLGVSGSDRFAHEPPTSAAEGFDDRTYVLKERIYQIEPSSLSIVFERTEPRIVERPDRPTLGRIECISRHVLVAEERLLPQIAYRQGEEFKWQIKVLRGFDGTEILRQGASRFSFGESRFQATPSEASRATSLLEVMESGWREVSQDNPLDHIDFKAEVDSADDHRLIVTWKNLLLNQTKIAVKVTGVTELGENLYDYVELNPGGCITTGSISEFFENIYKGLMAIEKLKELGLLPDPIPEDFSRLLGTNIQVSFRHREPYELIDILPVAFHDVFKSFFKILDGRVLTKRERNVLNRFAEEGAKMKWTSPPPKGLFEKMAHRINFYKNKKPSIREIKVRIDPNIPRDVIIPLHSGSISLSPQKRKK